MLAQHKAVWADEKTELNKRIEQLDAKVRESREALNKGTAEHAKVTISTEVSTFMV